MGSPHGVTHGPSNNGRGINMSPEPQERRPAAESAACNTFLSVHPQSFHHGLMHAFSQRYADGVLQGGGEITGNVLFVISCRVSQPPRPGRTCNTNNKTCGAATERISFHLNANNISCIRLLVRS